MEATVICESVELFHVCLSSCLCITVWLTKAYVLFEYQVCLSALQIAILPPTVQYPVPKNGH